MNIKALTGIFLAMILGISTATAATMDDKMHGGEKDYQVFSSEDNGFLRIHHNEAGKTYR